MFYNATFLDFIDEIKFLKLQNIFASYEEGFDPYNGALKSIVKEDFIIIEREYEVYKGEDCFYEKKSFYNDFLTPILNSLTTRFIDFFEARVNQGVYDVIKMAEYQSSKLLELKTKTQEIKFLKKELQEILLLELEKSIEYLNEIKTRPFFKLDKKINLKMNRIDVLNLFVFLRESGNMKYYSNSELRLLIEKNFCYYNKKEKAFKEIKTDTSTITDIFNGSTFSKNSLERIEEIFSKENIHKNFSS